jgi:hypothetical protein
MLQNTTFKVSPYGKVIYIYIYIYIYIDTH